MIQEPKSLCAFYFFIFCAAPHFPALNMCVIHEKEYMHTIIYTLYHNISNLPHLNLVLCLLENVCVPAPLGHKREIKKNLKFSVQIDNFGGHR